MLCRTISSACNRSGWMGSRTGSSLFHSFKAKNNVFMTKPIQTLSVTRRSFCESANRILTNPIHLNSSPTIRYWITGGAALVYGIICVGGITRLTESGLSMVDWKLQGSLPPKNEEEWQMEFNKYKKFPEFKKLFPSMTLDEFKNIFFWEYSHRMWGRAIGLYVGLPFLFYAATKRIRGPTLLRSALLLAGVGCQGLLGWWMVKSGLEEPKTQTEQPRVSQYRLAAHLGAALTLYSGMFWTAMDLWFPKSEDLKRLSEGAPKTFLSQFKVFRRSAAFTLGLVATTAISGAFVAGLDAGLAYNMFPYMEEGLLKAENAWNLRRLREHFSTFSGWLQDNLFDNTAAVQFNHRVLAVSSVSTISALYYYSRKIAPHLPRSARLARHSLLGVAVVQVSLGISTLLMLVPVKLAALHQAGSVALLSCSMWLLHALRRIRMLRGDAFKVLKSRGFIQALTCTEPHFEEYLNKKPITCYIGFDPTAESLHIGNLLQLMCLRHMQDAGHRPIALLGGATGMIGDPSGRSTERNLLDTSTIERNMKGIAGCVQQVLSKEGMDGKPPAMVINNHDWLKNVNLLDFLRDYGKLFKVQQMMNKHSVKSRMSQGTSSGAEGISFTEFSYQLLQAYDFYHLYKEKECSLQIGGSDQWGNITSGIQLIHRIIDPNLAESIEENPSSTFHAAYGLTLPLITTIDGKKLGKSSSAAGAAIWLDAEKTKPYDMYQYLVNLSDADAEKFLPLFTFLGLEQIDCLVSRHNEAPHHRLTQKTLASNVVEMLHGSEEVENAKKITATFFSSKSSDGILSLEDLPSSTPSIALTKGEVLSERLLSILAKTSLFQTNKEAKRVIKEQGFYMNNQRVEDVGHIITESDIQNGNIIFQKGKKKFFVLTITQDKPEE